MPFLLTWSTYAAHRPTENRPTKPAVSPSHPPFLLDPPRRQTALQSILETCRAESWPLHAVHVRTNHIHLVLDTSITLSSVFAILKTEITKALRRKAQAESTQPIWADYRNSRILSTDQALQSAIAYVLHRQGPPMHRFPDSQVPRDNTPR